MPIINQTPGWANALSGLITAYGLSQGAKNAKQEKQRQQGIDAQNTAIANAQLAQDEANTIKTYTDMGYTKNPKTNQWEATPVTLPPAPKGTPGTPAVQGIVKGRHVIKKPAQPGGSPTEAQNADYYRQVAASLVQTRPDLAAQYQKIADSYDAGAYRQAETQYTTQGRLPDIQQHTVNARDAFKHAMQLIDEHGKVQLQAAYQRHLRSGGSGSSPDKAMLAAMNEMSRTAYGEQIRSVMDQYNQGMVNYRAGNSDNPPPAPNVTNVPMTIYIQGPNGPTPITVGGPPHQNIAHQKKPAMAAPQTGGGGSPIENIGNWVLNALHGGGGGGGGQTKPQRLQGKSGGKTIYSDDGGKTWHP